MHLQSLELFGFKSFADKTLLNFHEGVTAIVGPNGCGKSNVLDAVRWVLGEQSAKALRGTEMADVIFNGTDNRKPLGFAEVSLTFSNCAGELSVDWHEVRVTRRVYRDGNSEYLLNKTACRLRDIQSLFADTGVGRSAYSVMEQGKIDMLLSSRPEDRRAVFEEAAGITKYKTQKREALRKLEATEANLLRIGDIIKEVKRQIGSLQRQAGKARRYQALHADLRVLDTHHSQKKLAALEAESAKCREEIGRLEKSERDLHAKIDIRENELAERRRALDDIDARINEARSEAQRLQSEIATHRSRIEFNRQRSEETTELIARYRRDISEAETKRSEQASELSEADTLIQQTSELLETKQRDVAELTAKAAQFRAERAESEKELETLHGVLSKFETRVAALENEIAGISLRRETTSARVADLAATIAEASTAREATRQKLDETRAGAEEHQRKLDLLRKESEVAESELRQDRQSLEEAEKNLATIERTIAEKESRLEILRQLNEEGEGLEHGSRAVLRGLDDPKRIRHALLGPLVSQLDVEREYIAAIEAALGRTIHAVVLQSDELAGEIVKTLSEKKLGQAALVVPGFAAAKSEKARQFLPEGALGWAADKVKAPEALAPLVRQLLVDVVIVRDLDAAWQLKRRAKEFPIATLTGEFLSAEGVIFGGRASKKADSLLERKAQITALAKEATTLGLERNTFRQKRDQSKARLDAAMTQQEEARKVHQSALLAHSTAGNEIELIERALSEAERKLENLYVEKAALQQQIETADERIGKLKEELTAHRTSFADMEAQQSSAEKARDFAREQEEEANQKLNELRLKLATEAQRHEHLLSRREPMTARETELAELIAARRADIATYEQRLALQAKESSESERAIQNQSAEVSVVEKKIAAIGEERASLLAASTAEETELRSARNSLNDFHDLRAKQQVRQSQLQLQIDNLLENISRRYQVDLRAFSQDEAAFEKTLQVQLKRTEKAVPEKQDVDLVAGDLEQIIVDLTRQLDNMGPVNLDAVQEYDELEERHKFLETQNSDLTNARRELLDVIIRINSTTQKLFAETFAQVRSNFRDMFAEMFGGGRADLSLMDENDPLNCGIEITAKPPGKQLQSISLLSGGERAMTAVALLFAIYMVRPSPFCILDEMDAPLDESNINRFIRVLERFVGQSQFIIITHNKRTIAKADILYGVTMEERGISKIVGMKLTAPREVATESTTNGHGEKPTQRHFPLEGSEAKRSFAAQR
ncbi:MAG: chromosome segregation protein [Verrucomicrobiota bacterium]|jgi:chromosome segregation protein